LMITYISCEANSVGDNLQSIMKVYRLAETNGFTQAELDQAKSKIRSRIVLSGERPHGRMFAVGGHWIYRREYLSVGDDLDAVAAVTLDDVHAVLKKYPLTECTTLTIGPLEKVPPPV
jgi:predicted Zn-dependent peptidase